MAIATLEVYNEMLDRAKKGKFAYPAVNVTSSQTIIAALQAYAEAESDGIIEVSVGGAEYASGSTVKNRVAGSLGLAAFAREVADDYPVTVALHTDHCAKQNIDSWIRPIMMLSAERVKKGQEPIFQSHMWDGSSVPLAENLVIAEELLALSQKAHTILEIEIGVVGGEEDGHTAEINEKLYTTVEDGLATVKALGLGEKGRYITALTFGEIQDGVGKAVGKKSPFDLVFHGGSGSTAEEIALAVSHGVIKMNIDTDAQYAFSRPVVDHMFKHYDGLLRIDGEVGNKKEYDPRAWGRAAESGMAARLIEACEQLGCAGKKMK